MSRKLSPPAAQHLARTFEDTSPKVAKALLKEYMGRAPFSYGLMHELVKVALKGKFSKEQFDAAIRHHQRNPKYQKIFLELSPLLHNHFSTLDPKYVLKIEPQKFRINDLEIPFKPPFAFEQSGELVIPLLIFWKENPLTEKQTSLLVTIANDLISQHPDYRDAKLLIYDFSVPPGEEKRKLRITDAATIPKMDAKELNAALEIWFKGYQLAKAKIAEMPARATKRRPDAQQQQLLDPPEG
jgi:hypothetical protein